MGNLMPKIKLRKECKQKVTQYTYVITPVTNNTWCYDIFQDEKLLIHQTSIPGIPGNVGFKTKSAAEKVALLVIEKLKTEKCLRV